MIVWVASYGELPTETKRTGDCCVIGVAATEDEAKALVQADLDSMSPGLFVPLEFERFYAPRIYDKDSHRWQAEIRRVKPVKNGTNVDSHVFIEPFELKGYREAVRG